MPHPSHGRSGPPAGAPAPPPGDSDESPPPLGSWATLYAAVIAGLVLMIALCWAITRWAS